MPIEAKIAPQTEGIASAPAQAVEGSVALPPGSSVALNVQPSAIAGYSREGGDLLVHLKTGEMMRVTGFYADPTKLSHLLLVQEDQLVAADLSQVAGAGMASAGYAPMNALAGFTAPATAEAAGGVAAGVGAAAGAGAGVIGAGTLIPLAALGGGALVVSAAGGGGGDDDTQTPSPPADTTPPVAATNLVVSAAGDRLTGTAEAGATVRVDTDGDGNPNYTVTSAADGTFAVALAPALVNGELIGVTVRDAAGNIGPAASIVAPDLTPPAAPQVTVAADGTGLTGSGEPGAVVSVDIDDDGSIDYTAVIAADGTFSVAFAVPLQDGEPISVVITDAAGNSSDAAMVIAPDLVPPPATAPVVLPTDGSAVSGTAQSGVGIVLTDAAGTVVGQTAIAADASWFFTPPAPLPDGTVLSVAAINSEGQPGPAAIVTVDAVAPEAPVVSPTNGTGISGTAESGATVLLQDGTGNTIGQTTASASGAWSFTPSAPLSDGTVIVAFARDAAGNTSGPGSATVDAVAPAIPTIAPPGATMIYGTAEPGSTVMLSDGAGNPIGQASVDGGGNWTFTAPAPLPDGSTVTATAQDAAGNLSVAATAVVDANAPAIPTVSPTTGAVLSGSAEPGALVVLTAANGIQIGQVTVGPGGNWTLTLDSPLSDGTVVNVIARDPAGNESPVASITVDATPPDAPVIQPSAGVTVTGTAEPASLILLTDQNGAAIGQAIVDGTGNWSVTLASTLPDGVVVTATAQDAAGNVSQSATQIIDGAAPAAPTLALSNGTVLSGTAEAGATVVLTAASGSLIGRALADSSGNWSLTPTSPLPDGFVVNALAQDDAGNTSGATSITIDAVAPSAPVIDPSNGAVVSGTAEAGTTVTLSDGNGNSIGQVGTDGSGNWSFTPATSLPDGTVIQAIASDATGNVSAVASTTVDAVAPATPVLDPSNGNTITGTAEADVTVILTDGNGNPIGQTLVDDAGNWSFTPGSPLLDGTVVNATAQDAAGNASGSTSTTIDGTAPDSPVIDPTDGNQVTGSAEANALLVLTDGDGNALGQVVVDGFGTWNFTPDTPLPDGTVVNATAQDAAGNISAAASTTVDAVPPVDPTINPTNGSQVTGTAEPNSTVVLMDGTGNTFAAFMPMQDSARSVSIFSVSSNVPALGLPIGEVAADEDGNWIFTPLLPLPDGTVVIAVSVDAAGNVSNSVNTIVDGVAPATPTINPSAGIFVEGTTDPDVTIRLTDLFGNLIGEVAADRDGNWSFTPDVPLPDGTVIEAIAIDAAGNESLAAVSIVDAMEPLAPIVAASNGTVISGTTEANAFIIINDALGLPIGEAIADENGNWSFTPPIPLPDGTQLIIVAQDAAGNTSPGTTLVTDSLPPASPVLVLLADGELLNGTAEPGSQVRIVINGDTANPVVVTADGNGNFSLPLLPPLVGGETISAVAIDAAGNESQPALIISLDIAPPAIEVPEATDGWVNGAEASDGIQVEVTLRPTIQVGQTITATLNGQGGYQAQASHVIGAGDLLAGFVVLSVLPLSSAAGFPQGAATITAGVGGGDASSPAQFVIDTISPQSPVLSLAASLLTISSEPNSQVTVTADVDGVVASTVVTANNNGLASVNLLTGLNLGLDWSQLLDAQVSAVGRDAAGNESNVATLSVAPLIEQPVTIHNLGVAVSLNPLSPAFGVTGTTDPNSSVAIRVITPALNVQLLPIAADSSGHFTLNLLSPTILTQLGLNITDILNLGSQISLGLVATDPEGHQSASYGLALSPAGLSLNIGQIDVNGTTGDDILSGSSSAEHINGNSGNDLIYNVAAGDHVLAGPGNDTVELTATNFSTVDGGTGFDTLLLANGIDLDYGPGVGTLANIERIDLGSGDSGSVLTLTASEVAAITDAGDTLQITGEANDVLRITGAVDSGTTQAINGHVYDVYSFGATTVLVEENTVQVVV